MMTAVLVELEGHVRHPRAGQGDRGALLRHSAPQHQPTDPCTTLAREPTDVVRNWWGQMILSLPFTWEVSPYVWDLGAREEMTARLKRWANLEALPKDH